MLLIELVLLFLLLSFLFCRLVLGGNLLSRREEYRHGRKGAISSSGKGGEAGQEGGGSGLTETP